MVSALIVPAHDHQWVTPRIAVGSALWNEQDVKSALYAGVTHVIDCRRRPSEFLFAGIRINDASNGTSNSTGISYFHCGIGDDFLDVDLNGHAWFSRGWQIARGVLGQSEDARLLVHCQAGQHRSPSMVYAIMRASGYDAGVAESKIVRARPVARIRFKQQVEQWLASGGAQ